VSNSSSVRKDQPGYVAGWVIARAVQLCILFSGF
jgi:hypothetical protein